MNNIGSDWRKCDLHLHSPYTHLSNGYQGVSKVDYINKIKDSHLEIVGLTNYFNFKEEDYTLKTELEKAGIVVFLNLELRLPYTNTDNDCCDIHIIFHNSLKPKNIKDMLTRLSVGLGDKSELAQNLNSKDHFKKAVVEFDHLLGVLSDEASSLEGKYLIGFLSRGKGNSRSSNKFKDIVRKTHFLIHSSDNPQNLLDDRNFWLNHNKPLIQSSDAHNIKQIGAKYCWIKAEPTFEGLKQIKFEPEYRINIGKNKPIAPLNRIENIQFNIPSDTQVGEDDFCFAGENKTYHLSPYFNCFIGGRGSGKSTILSFIGQKASSKDEYALREFWDNLDLDFKDDIDSVFSLVGTEQFEFLGQSQIESFAKNKVEFTKAIYDRANILSDYSLESYELETDEHKSIIDGGIRAIEQASKCETKIAEYNKQLKTLSSSMKFMQSGGYKEITDIITRESQELRELRDSKEGLSDFKQKLRSLSSKSLGLSEFNPMRVVMNYKKLMPRL